MKRTRELLRRLTKLISPMSEIHVTLQQGVLVLRLLGNDMLWHTFNLQDDDMDKSVDDLVEKITRWVKEQGAPREDAGCRIGPDE